MVIKKFPISNIFEWNVNICFLKPEDEFLPIFSFGHSDLFIDENCIT